MVPLVWLGFPLSRTVATTVDVPLTVGVPEIKPVVGLMLKPEGRVPEVIDHEYGALPPIAFRLSE
jgi:hypothetical protein